MKAHSIKILGVLIDNYSRQEIEKLLRAALKKESAKYFVATINPEILLKGEKENEYKYILNDADLRLCDGFGIKLLSFLRGSKIYSRYTGVDVLDFILKQAELLGLKVLVIAKDNSLSTPQEIISAIQKKYQLGIEAKYSSEQNIFESNKAQSAEIIIVNFGAPEQEYFIFESKEKFPRARILVGVGGALDFLTEKIRRAPLGFQEVGLEWLWRLYQEPNRCQRIWNAVVVFPIKAIFAKD